MNTSIIKFSRTVPLLFWLALLILACLASCSKPNLGDIVREHVKAVNDADVKRNLALFTDDIVFEFIGLGSPATILGKDQLRNMMESDAVDKARLTIKDIKVEGNTVTVKTVEKNEAFQLLGIDEFNYVVVFSFRDLLIAKVRCEGTPESAKLFNEKYKPFAEWGSKEHPQEFNTIDTGPYTAENARILLSLLREWREKTRG